MRGSAPRRPWLATLVYPLVAAPVTFASVVLALWLRRLGFGHTFFRSGDVELGVALVAVGTPLFALATVALARFERLTPPRLLDHPRHAALLYVWIVWWIPVLVLSHDRAGRGLGWGLQAMTVAVALWGIAINALVLGLRRRRPQPDAEVRSAPGAEGP